MVDITEQVFLERIKRADHLVAAQRVCVHRLRTSGRSAAQPQALLRLTETIAAQFHAAWQLYRMHQAELSVQPQALLRPAMPSPMRSAAAQLAACSCAHCGLALALDREDGRTVHYQAHLWSGQCRHRSLQTPVLCQSLPGSGEATH